MKPRCPSCGSDALLPIEYGYPDDDLRDAAERGKVEIGGCIFGPDAPAMRCQSCGAGVGGLHSTDPAFAVHSFDEHFRGWAEEAAGAWGYPEPGDSYYERVRRRLPAGLRAVLAMGLDSGALLPQPGGKFRVAGVVLEKGPYAFFSRSPSQQEPAPNWEYFVQVAEFIRVRRVLATTGYAIGFEDELMDVSVRDPVGTLLWCIEVKERASALDDLLAGIRRHAGGPDDTLPDRGNDGLRKAKYIARARPAYFSLVAVGKRLDFRVDGVESGRFTLIEDVIPYG